MFYIKNDNIEDLFREAAEKYHIDTAGAEAWEDVKAAVHSDDMPPTPPGGQKRKRKWFVFMWLLLIPLGWFAHNAWTALNEPKQEKSTQLTVQKAQLLQQEAAKSTTSTRVQQTNTKNNTQSENTQQAVATTKLQKSSTDEKQPLTSPYGYKPAAKQASSFMRVKQAGIATNNSFNTKPGNKLPGLGLLAEGTTGKTTPVAENTVEKNAKSTGVVPQSNENDAQPVGQSAFAEKVTGDTAITAGNTIKTGGQDSIANNNSSNTKRSSKPKSNHYFYVGLSAAPDVSFIHFQKTSVLGLGAGVLFGYQINKKLSVETGLMLDKKNYYTDGKYFDKSKLPYGNNISLKDVEGYCKMAEIPVNIRYTFSDNTTQSFYGLAGLSSYIMGKQFYEYGYTWMTNYYNKIYRSDKVAAYPFSVVNLGIGYEKKIGHNTNLRVEPYMKVPLAGLGAGSLKIASAGLYMTITKKIP